MDDHPPGRKALLLCHRLLSWILPHSVYFSSKNEKEESLFLRFADDTKLGQLTKCLFGKIIKISSKENRLICCGQNEEEIN